MNLIVMLTYNDYTVKDALAVFEACKDAPVDYWGAKEQGIPPEELKRLFLAIKAHGKKAVLEVVAYTEEESLAGAKVAVDCGCDILLGTKFFPSVFALCREHKIQYMPFVGEVTGRPSVLEGSAASMLAEIRTLQEAGVCGVDLLGYRYRGDCKELGGEVVTKSPLPVCLAGSIHSVERLDEVKSMRPAYYTVGSAFFEQSFGTDIREQVDFVCNYMKESNG